MSVVTGTQLDEVHNVPLSQENEPLDPVLEAFQSTVRSNGLLQILGKCMFLDSTREQSYQLEKTQGTSRVRDFEHMLELFNTLLTKAPEFYDGVDPNSNALLGFPFNAILNKTMSTTAGHMFFSNPDVNHHLKAILTKWGRFLESQDSAKTLNNVDGWFSKDAVEQLTSKANGAAGTSLAFEELYQCPDSSDPSRGFKSWDHFFTREFNWKRRPVESPDDDSVIVHSCESTPWRKKEGVKLWDKFYLKGQPYAIQTMFNNEPEAALFAGGSVYQAFLSTLTYHRWHAPVSGKITKVGSVAGTYYSENLYDGFADPAAPDRSQAYIAHSATRTIILIEASDPNIGLMGIVYVGMAECSSCEATVWEGQRVTKGDQLGAFHYGGSTHCLVFRPQTALKWKDNLMEQTKENQAVRSLLAVSVPPP